MLESLTKKQREDIEASHKLLESCYRAVMLPARYSNSSSYLWKLESSLESPASAHTLCNCSNTRDISYLHPV